MRLSKATVRQDIPRTLAETYVSSQEGGITRLTSLQGTFSLVFDCIG